MSGRDHVVALGPVLQALAREIDGPRQAILAVEQHLAAVLRSGQAVEVPPLDLQGLDLALQVLDDLDAFAARLGHGLPADLRVDAGPALRGLRLERVAARLGSACGAGGPPLPTQPSIELF